MKSKALIAILAIILCCYIAQIAEIKDLRKSTDNLSSEISDLADQQSRTWDKLDAMPTYTPQIVETTPAEESIVNPDIPLSDDLQEYTHHICQEYGVDKSLVLAVMEVESDYTVDIVSPGGDYGLMQIAPVNHEWLADMGMDVTTPEGNIEAGVYMLSLASRKYTEPAQILMAYNMGHSGAARAIESGTTCTHYTDKVMTVLQPTAKKEDKQ